MNKDAKDAVDVAKSLRSNADSPIDIREILQQGALALVQSRIENASSIEDSKKKAISILIGKISSDMSPRQLMDIIERLDNITDSEMSRIVGPSEDKAGVKFNIINNPQGSQINTSTSAPQIGQSSTMKAIDALLEAAGSLKEKQPEVIDGEFSTDESSESDQQTS